MAYLNKNNAIDVFNIWAKNFFAKKFVAVSVTVLFDPVLNLHDLYAQHV